MCEEGELETIKHQRAFRHLSMVKASLDDVCQRSECKLGRSQLLKLCPQGNREPTEPGRALFQYSRYWNNTYMYAKQMPEGDLLAQALYEKTILEPFKQLLTCAADEEVDVVNLNALAWARQYIRQLTSCLSNYMKIIYKDSPDIILATPQEELSDIRSKLATLRRRARRCAYIDLLETLSSF